MCVYAQSMLMLFQASGKIETLFSFIYSYLQQRHTFKDMLRLLAFSPTSFLSFRASPLRLRWTILCSHGTVANHYPWLPSFKNSTLKTHTNRACGHIQPISARKCAYADVPEHFHTALYRIVCVCVCMLFPGNTIRAQPHIHTWTDAPKAQEEKGVGGDDNWCRKK